ncbi:hypothetical protein TcBrA4_0037830 [Trypanosoma cruzi]|nr:hypothetical protein TcBrA4_0037830 [Trypanosoma cruzi]
MAAEGGPVAGGFGRKGKVNSEGNSNQEDEDGGENTAGEGHNPTSGGALTAPTRQDQSSSDPLRSNTCNPSGTGSVSAARMRASGPESLGGGHAGGGRTPRAVRLRNKPSRVPGTAKEAPQDDEGEPGAQHEADQTTKMTVVTSCAETAVEGELPAGSQEAPRKGMRSPGIEPGPPALMMREFSHWTNCALNTILLPFLSTKSR